MPPPVLVATVDALEQGRVRRVAFGVDVRVRKFLDKIGAAIDAIATPAREVGVLFLDASDQILLRRFSSTRRPHPLSTISEPGAERAATAVLDGIRIERERLGALRIRATRVIDTTRMSVHELRREVLEAFGPGVGGVPRLRTRFVSFGFKYGAPLDADQLFDLRFLQNPYFVDELRELPGTNERVRDYVLGSPGTVELIEKITDLLSFTLPRFEREGKSYLTVGFGCTGGQHRSVVISEAVENSLRDALGIDIEVVHRDVGKAAIQELPSEPDAGRRGPL
jgi:UPF0042 nucleotide-binding protein